MVALSKVILETERPEGDVHDVVNVDAVVALLVELHTVFTRQS